MVGQLCLLYRHEKFIFAHHFIFAKDSSNAKQYLMLYGSAQRNFHKHTFHKNTAHKNTAHKKTPGNAWGSSVFLNGIRQTYTPVLQ